MRILTVSNTPHDSSQGSGYAITGYTDRLRERGHTVDAYGPADWTWWEVQRGRRYFFSVMIAVFVFLNCRPWKYDLIELWGGPTWLLAISLRALNLETPIVHHSNGIEQHRVEVQRHSPVADIQLTRWFQVDLSRFYDWGLHAADAIVTLCSYDVPYLRKRGYVPDDRVYAIESPLPEAFIGQSVDYDRPKRIGFCGHWTRVKGIHLLTSDLPPVLRENPEWTFSLVGVGDSDVKVQFPSDVRDQIEVISFLQRSELIEWYQSLAIFVLPSIYESFGLVMTEAMACGTALVATNVGFANELKHRDEAFILPTSQTPHLTEALTTLVENESLRRTIARNGYDRVQELRWSEAVDRLESVYESLIADASPSA